MGIGPGSQVYREGQFKPKPGHEHNWHVWCKTGALEVLENGEHVKWLEGDNDGIFSINFGNASAARVSPEHPLWKKLAEVAESYDVGIFPLGLATRDYVPWAESPEDRRQFDTIQIKKKGRAA